MSLCSSAKACLGTLGSSRPSCCCFTERNGGPGWVLGWVPWQVPGWVPGWVPGLASASFLCAWVGRETQKPPVASSLPPPFCLGPALLTSPRGAGTPVLCALWSRPFSSEKGGVGRGVTQHVQRTGEKAVWAQAIMAMASWCLESPSFSSQGPLDSRGLHVVPARSQASCLWVMVGDSQTRPGGAWRGTQRVHLWEVLAGPLWSFHRDVQLQDAETGPGILPGPASCPGAVGCTSLPEASAAGLASSCTCALAWGWGDPRGLGMG